MAGVRDRIEHVLGDDRADPRWADRIEALLYDGESLRETVQVADSRVVVTSHRVLAFTPDSEGAPFRQVQRPNVVRVRTGAESDGGLLARGVRWIVIGGILIGAGTLLDVDGLVGSVDLTGSETGGIGIGGVLGAVQSMLDFLRQLDAVLQVLGALAMLLGGLVLGAYLLTRTPTLVLEIGGEQADVHLPRPGDGGATVERLEAAIHPDDAVPAGGPNGESRREA